MKNHWLKLRKSRNSKFHTIEFMDSGFYVLKPRKVQLLELKTNITNSQRFQGEISVLFIGALLPSNTDMEMVSFCSQVKKSMSSWACKLRYYSSNQAGSDIFTQTNFSDYETLSYNYISAVGNMQDMKLDFYYATVKHYDCI